MVEVLASAVQRAAFYEAHQEWPSDVARGVAACLRQGAPRARSAAFLGCGTGINDAIPFARTAPDVRVLASDVDSDYLQALSARANGLSNLEVRKVDVAADLATLAPVDLLAMFFVIHRLADWESVVPGLVRLVAPDGRFFTSEFGGPSGIIYLSNERGGSAPDSVSRLIRRYHELRPEPFFPALRSTFIRPFLEAVGRGLAYAGFRDFAWSQSLSVGDMYAKVESGAYAPFFSPKPSEALLGRLREEFSREWSERVQLIETIRVHEFRQV